MTVLVGDRRALIPVHAPLDAILADLPAMTPRFVGGSNDPQLCTGDRS